MATIRHKTIPVTVFCRDAEEAVALAAGDKNSRAMTKGIGTLHFHSLIAEHGAGVFKTLYAPERLSHQWRQPVGGIVLYTA